MAEYIERDRARFEFERFFKDKKDVKGDCDSLLCTLPAAEVAPVVHGEWVNVVHALVDTTGDCTKCGKQAVWRTRNKPYAICPNCGAKMYGGKHEKL